MNYELCVVYCVLYCVTHAVCHPDEGRISTSCSKKICLPERSRRTRKVRTYHVDSACDTSTSLGRINRDGKVGIWNFIVWN